MTKIREHVTCEQYQVDCAAVARALVERLLAGRTVAPNLR